MKILCIIFITVLFAVPLLSQDEVSGNVRVLEKGQKIPLINASVYWLNSSTGVVSDKSGYFSIPRVENAHMLVISYIGYKSDTVHIEADRKSIKIILQPSEALKEVEIADRKESTYISKLDPLHAEKITGEELHKAACCNLSESFETNASVDVHYSDAVTGAKQIQLLGLAGTYSQIMSEKTPLVRGLSQPFGLGYIPGSWMESIQVSKGTSTVDNGYESITGQINVEYKKPDKGEKFFINLLINDKGKGELNSNARLKLTERWSTMFFLHGEANRTKHDGNKDGFLDQPLLEQVNFLNRWKYMGKKFMTQFGLKYLQEDRLGGQMAYDDSKSRNSNNGYGIGIHSERAEIYHKMGFILDRPSTSFGFIQSGSVYDQSSFFGLREYEGNQKSYYSNLIFQTYFGTTDHNINTGLSFIYDEFHEQVDSSHFNRVEKVPGAYFQYTYTTGHIFTAIAGIRADYHNLWGLFFTPRVHLRYQANEDLVFRASGGKGYRTASVFAENTYVLANSRRLVFIEDMKQEEAWNFGLSATQDFHVGKRDLKFKIEYYRTDFINQVIVDMDADISEVRFYNLDGRSFSNSFQIETSYEPVKRLDVTAAYRLTDVRMDINNQLQQKPLVNRYKGLLTFSYITKLKKWQFDLTVQLNGDGRLPESSQIPATYRTDDLYPTYYLLNAQITKYFRKWEVYAGGENLTNFIQKDPIIASDDPYGPFFDASRVWGPLMGRKLYLGIRYTID